MAQGSPTRWYAAFATLIVFVLLAWLLGAVLTLSEGERVALRVGLVALGLIAAAALLWYLRPQDASLEAEPGDAKDDALTAIAAARSRLRSALSSQPLVLVLGTDGSCKTTVVTRSGLDPELLAGAAAGDPPPPTTAANLWAVRGAVLAEAGAAVLADGARWRRFVRALRPAGLRAAVGRGEQASRAVVACVSCEVFYGGDAGEQLDATAQLLRERVGEIAREWGLAVPVYVIFTRADRIPHFEAWAAPLSRDEVRAPLGAALPYDVATGAAAGSYAERLAPRLAQAFDGLGTALAAWRPELLGRESVAERRLDAYEFPRELSKLAPAASRLLVELCRPKQLGVVPMLRGFYFVGARPVVVTDVRATPAVAGAPGVPPAPPLVGGGATRAFAQQAALAAATAAPTYAPPTTRRVPQWTFLERLFPEVVLADGGAAVSARGGVRVSRLRRALLATGIAAAMLVVVGVATSWLGNRALAARTVDAARAVASLPVVEAAPGTVVFPSPQALRTLDGLRAVLDTLRGYDREGPPLRLRWGLWSGASLADAARPAWLAGYSRQLHGSAWSALVDSLRALPEAPRPGDDYGRTYGALRAYLVMTTEPARAVPEQLAPVLLATWQRGQPTDADVTALARRQFEWYAGELPRANPFPTASDAAVVRRAREFLGRFAGTEQIYQYMLAEASKAAPPARLAVLAPNAAGVVSAPGDVPGPFTAAGWKFMQDAFRDSDRFFQGERWVMGDATVARAEDRDRVLAELRARYRAEYVQRWRAWVRGLSVARAGTVRDAAQRLGTLGGAQSPLLAALSLAARNTVVDSAMRAAFQPVHAVTPGNVVDRFVSEGNNAYVTGLLSVQGAMEQVGNMPPPVDTASALALAQGAQQALASATQAKVAARQLAQKFAVDTAAAQVAPAVSALLVAPIDAAEATLRTVAAVRPPAARVAAAGGGGAGGGGGAPPPVVAPPAAPAAPVPPSAPPAELTRVLNERGRALCTTMAPMLAKFPFNPDATAEATVAEVVAMLAPGTGALWSLQQERLEGLLEKQGEQWVAKAGAPVALSGQFVAFFNRAAQVSAALFPAGSPEPRVLLTARGVATEKAPTILLQQGTQTARFGTNTPPAQISWPSATGRDAKLAIEFRHLMGVRGDDRTVARASGEWALFRLVAQAAKWEGGAGAYRAEWRAGDRGPVVVELTFPSGAPVLQRGWLGGMSCASQVTR